MLYMRPFCCIRRLENAVCYRGSRKYQFFVVGLKNTFCIGGF